MPGELDREITQNSAQGAATALSCSLGGQPGKRTYVAEINIVMGGATAATQVTATLVSVQGGNRSIEVNVPLGANAQPTIIREQFNPPLKSTGTQTTLTLNLPSGGPGNVVASCDIHGFFLPEP